MQTPTMTSPGPDGTASPILLVFVDGVGLGVDRPGNPLADRRHQAIAALAGGPLVAGSARSDPARCVSEVDATLGVAGLPQSATGQTALFTGVNAARVMGRHVPAFPGPRLKAILEADGLLARTRAAGLDVAFANAFTPSYLEELAAGRRRVSVTVHLARCAGLVLRSEVELMNAQAVTWDFDRGVYREAIGPHVPAVSAATAGAHLAGIAAGAAGHHLTLYETFLTDLAGHGRIPVTPAQAIARLDAFLGGVLAARPRRLTLVLSSDHGNVEEPEHGRHTRNPVPIVAFGPLARHFAGLRSLDELTPAILRALAVDELGRAAGSGPGASAPAIALAVVAQGATAVADGRAS